MSGSSGHSGRAGAEGASGRAGTAGTVTFAVVNDDADADADADADGEGGASGSARRGETTYDDIYSLVITSVGLPSSPDGIIEPDEVVAFTALTVRNDGPMPTPAVHPPCIRVHPSRQVVPVSPAEAIVGAVAAHRGEYKLADPLAFRVCPPELVLNTVPVQSIDVVFEALLPCVRKSFPRIDQQFKTVEVRYPVELGLKTVAAISRDEEAPFVLSVHNVSTEALGSASQGGRPVRIALSVARGEPLEWLAQPDDATWTAADVQRGSGPPAYFAAPEGAWRAVRADDGPVTVPLPYLGPGATVYVSGTLRFLNPEAAPYATAVVQVQLELGALAPTEPAAMVVVQRNQTQLQMAEAYHLNPAAEFVLVVTSASSATTVDEWQQAISRVGATAMVWNSSLYGGLDLAYVPAGASLSLQEQWRGKVVVVLSNAVVANDATSEEAGLLLTAPEILVAAATYGVAVYLVGDTPTIEMSALTSAPPGEWETVQLDVTGRSLTCTGPPPASAFSARLASAVSGYERAGGLPLRRARALCSPHGHGPRRPDGHGASPVHRRRAYPCPLTMLELRGPLKLRSCERVVGWAPNCAPDVYLTQ